MGRWYKEALQFLDSNFEGKKVALFVSAMYQGENPQNLPQRSAKIPKRSRRATPQSRTHHHGSFREKNEVRRPSHLRKPRPQPHRVVGAEFRRKTKQPKIGSANRRGTLKMEFPDTVYAAGMFLLAYVLLFVPLYRVVGFTTFLMPNSIILAFLISGLIVGVVFAKKLASHRLVSIGKILLLIAIAIVFFILASNVIDWTANKDIYQSTQWTAGQWSQEMVVMLYITMGLYTTMGLAIIGAGIYVGSILRKIKPSKQGVLLFENSVLWG